MMFPPVVVTLPGAPIGKARPRFWNGRAVTPETTRSYEQALGWAAREAMGARAPLKGALAIRIEAAMPIPRSYTKAQREAIRVGKISPTKKPDLDNIVKLCDGLNGIVWADDAQITCIVAHKFYGDPASLKIMIWPIHGADDEAVPSD